MAHLITLLAQARGAGIVLDTHPDGGLRIQAPRTAAAIAKELRARQGEVRSLVRTLQTAAPVLNWRDARIDDPEPCLLCHRPAILRDPYDQQPMHKTCAERLLAEAADQLDRRTAA